MVGISGSNPAKDVYVLLFSLFVVCFVSSGLCDELITRPDESYRVCVCVVCGICVCVWCVCVCVCVCVWCVWVCVCLILCDLETSKVRRPKPELECCTTEDGRIKDCVCGRIVNCVYSMNLEFVCRKFMDCVCSRIMDCVTV